MVCTTKFVPRILNDPVRHLRLSGHPAAYLQSVFHVATESSMNLGIGVFPAFVKLALVSGKFPISSDLPGYVSLAKENFAFL